MLEIQLEHLAGAVVTLLSVVATALATRLRAMLRHEREDRARSERELLESISRQLAELARHQNELNEQLLDDTQPFEMTTDEQGRPLLRRRRRLGPRNGE